MKPWALWVVRIVLVSLGLLLAIGPVTDALGSERDLSGLARVGGLLRGAGFFALIVCTAINFPHTWRRLGDTRKPPVGLRGLRGQRRAVRQIDGKEPYRADDVAYLRWLADRRVTDRRWSPITLATGLSIVTLLVGIAVSPPEVVTTSSDDLGWYVGLAHTLQSLSQVLRPAAGVMALGCVALVVAEWRMRDDVKGKAFLERT